MLKASGRQNSFRMEASPGLMPAALTRTRTFPGPGVRAVDFYHLQNFEPTVLIESYCTRHSAFSSQEQHC